MHEWALAESVVKTAAEHSKNEKLKKLSEVGVVFGELQAIDQEIFSFALKELVKNNDKISACKFKVINEPAAFKCKVCGKEFSLKSLKKTDVEAEYIHFIPEMAHTFLKCPKCASPDFEITAGRGVYIKYLKGLQ
ncbi:MAG: hydrogenase nickel incorporation protein HypA [Elusimicrobia bacterium]|nr:hydrogenase nickel incorporation protein HypA [Elusimicrobiota bacterium]